MESRFKGWDIDCKYNRNGLLLKELHGIKQCDYQKKTDRIFPDIIVHHRVNEENLNNLLVIEIKHSAVEDPCDKLKLKLLTSLEGQY